MPTIANMPAADVPVTFADGRETIVNMIVLLAETQDAEMYAKHGVHLGRNHRTIKQLREHYDLDFFFGGPVRTWADTAAVLRHLHTLLTEHINRA